MLFFPEIAYNYFKETYTMDDDMINKAVGAAGLAGGAVMFSPLGFPFLFHGLSGIVVGGLGAYAANAVIGKIAEQNKQIQSSPASPDKDGGESFVQDDILQQD